MTITRKHCKKCGKDLPVSEFYAISKQTSPDGLEARCKSCFKANAAAKAITMTEKFCYKCGKTKSVSEFHKSKGSHDSYQTKCKSCINAKTALVRAQKLNQAPAAVVKEWNKNGEVDEIREFYDNCPEGYHVDHIVPLNGVAARGLHILENLQYLPASENISKGNRQS